MIRKESLNQMEFPFFNWFMHPRMKPRSTAISAQLPAFRVVNVEELRSDKKKKKVGGTEKSDVT